MTSNDINLSIKKLGTKGGLISKNLTPDKLADLYYQQKKSLEDIAKEYNCSRQTVKWLMEKYNLKRRNRSEGGLISEKLTEDKLMDLYFHQNKSLQDIAKEYNCTRPMVKLLMEKYGLQRRKRSKARVLAIKEGKFKNFKYYDINENFFSVWAPQMAWVLGLLFTDGNVQTRRTSHQSISISSIDLDLLENVNRFLKTIRPIRKCIQSHDKTRHIYQLEFYREKMRDDLHNLGLIEKKSLIMEFPDVPDEYIRHFIRGCWDGDGTVYIDRDCRLNAAYVSGSYEFIKQMVVELAKVGITRQSEESFLNIHKDKRSNAYSIRLNSRKNLETLFHFFYDNVNETVFLRRKYDVFVKGLNISKQEIQKHKEEMQRHYREVSSEYTAISIRDVIQDVKKVQKKRVLTINNTDRLIKCKRCGVISETLYMVNQPYCPSCFISCFRKEGSRLSCKPPTL